MPIHLHSISELTMDGWVPSPFSTNNIAHNRFACINLSKWPINLFVRENFS